MRVSELVVGGIGSGGCWRADAAVRHAQLAALTD
jgi:hypothetical protein